MEKFYCSGARITQNWKLFLEYKIMFPLFNVKLKNELTNTFGKIKREINQDKIVPRCGFYKQSCNMASIVHLADVCCCIDCCCFPRGSVGGLDVQSFCVVWGICVASKFVLQVIVTREKIF